MEAHVPSIILRGRELNHALLAFVLARSSSILFMIISFRVGVDWSFIEINKAMYVASSCITVVVIMVIGRCGERKGSLSQARWEYSWSNPRSTIEVKMNIETMVINGVERRRRKVRLASPCDNNACFFDGFDYFCLSLFVKQLQLTLLDNQLRCTCLEQQLIPYCQFLRRDSETLADLIALMIG
ncbi:hypothetical protein J5N97_022272 [Dioscorea zingiberensis]|uniref:Uncharacterized protein n=1 Tax=Dioscorea zingiberensis TaxID=325984 RepID=A0A9D5CAW7_9LILI|nr:hypothetical protein J5N97_022272 [Dioscorea zingiberensis]